MRERVPCKVPVLGLDLNGRKKHFVLLRPTAWYQGRLRAHAAAPPRVQARRPPRRR